MNFCTVGLADLELGMMPLVWTQSNPARVFTTLIRSNPLTHALKRQRAPR